MDSTRGGMLEACRRALQDRMEGLARRSQEPAGVGVWLGEEVALRRYDQQRPADPEAR
jgi:hypothetical protein